MLFSEGYALQTVLLWIIYFCSLMNLFLFAYWMPTVLNLIGMTPSEAVFASSLRDFGAMFAVLYLGMAIDRIGPERTLALHYAAGAVFIAMIALVALPYALLLLVSFLAGMTITGSQTGPMAPAASSIPRACARAASDGRSGSGGSAVSPRPSWAATCWRSASRRRASSSAPVSSR